MISKILASFDPEDVPTTNTVQPRTNPNIKMRATEWQGSKDVRVTDRQKPMITDNHDAIIKVTSATICGSDLHMYNGDMPEMKSGDILGHECMGVVEEVGSDTKSIKPGQRVVISCLIACGFCQFCKAEKYSLCNNTNPSTFAGMIMGVGHGTSGGFGYSHLSGGYPGGQAEYIRVPYADMNCLPVPDKLGDEQVLLLSDVLCTSWHANELGEVNQGSTVAIWGAGPIGLAAAAWAKYRGAAGIVIIDEYQYRLDVATAKVNCHTINFRQSSNVVKDVLKIFPDGPDVAIDAVGFRYAKTILHKLEKAMMLETDAIDSVTEAIMACKKGGIVVLIGDYIGFCNHFPVGVMMEKGLRLTGSQVFVQKYWQKLLSIIEAGEFDPTWLITHTVSLEEAPHAYKLFNNKEDNALKIILKPKN